MTDRCKGQNLVCIHQIEEKKEKRRVMLKKRLNINIENIFQGYYLNSVSKNF